jgi:type I restriction enzyme, R subunit
MDFRKATDLFADPAFDGDPVQMSQPGPDDPPSPLEDEEVTTDEEDGGGGGEIPTDPPIPGPGRVKYIVADVPVYVIAERVQYYGKDGKLITESLKDYTRKAVRNEYASLDSFLSQWSKAEQKQEIVQELEEQGILLEPLAEQVGKDFDPFDLICHVAFDQPPLTRRERAEQVRKRDYFTKYGEQARAVLNALLDKYADEGIANIESLNVLRVQPINQLGTPLEIIHLFGGKRIILERCGS